MTTRYRTDRSRRRSHDQAPQPSTGIRQVPLPTERTLGILRHPHTDPIARGNAARALQRTVGNASLQRTIAGVVQREPQQAGDTPEAAAAKAAAEQGGAWDTIVQAKLEAFLRQFQEIPVRVNWSEGGTKKTTVVKVHPPYFINTRKFTNSKIRMEAAERNRKQATGSTGKIPVKSSWQARHGKATRHEIQQILQDAVDSGKLPAPAGKQHPDASDMRAWLITYGVGIDCSGFVSQALNEVMAEMHTQAGEPASSGKGLNKGSAGLKGGAAGFSTVAKPGDLRPGDTMYIPGHIRIVMAAETTEDGAVVFTTAESRAGGTDSKGQLRDVGPDRAVWRYNAADTFGKLEKQRSSKWVRSGEKPTFGRYKALAKFAAEHVPKDARTPAEPGKAPGAPAASKGKTTSSLGDLIDTAKQFIAKVGTWTTALIDKVFDLVRAGQSWLALTQAIASGERDEIQLTDLVFHARHPELGGRRIKRGEQALIDEWQRIRANQVRPALARAADAARP